MSSLLQVDPNIKGNSEQRTARHAAGLETFYNPQLGFSKMQNTLANQSCNPSVVTKCVHETETIKSS